MERIININTIQERRMRLRISGPGMKAARESRRRNASLNPAGIRWSGEAPFLYAQGVLLFFFIFPLKNNL